MTNERSLVGDDRSLGMLEGGAGFAVELSPSNSLERCAT
jgi:hypothetical protein